ncbi:TonB-dependent receptor domain-containing protein [Novosphingobium rosa]|uniref:TonB-dependent receptor domain-containing protein n=1 Tax=Novosphingobium rosa TaxID=76978 RepID=UPI00082AC0EE|nr:TonB-dependent receptor [Novosphingobium rosa]
MKTRSSILLCGVSAMAWAMPALAQTAAPQPDQAAAGSASAVRPSDQDIIVTGSRTIKNGNASPMPVTVVSTDDLLKVQPGATLADALNTIPAFSGSRGSSSNPTTIGSAAGGNGSANQLNLRNLGTTRTLVLMDGKRVAPTLFNGAVDVDVIPQALVERVDIVTGGVSAVYGSDAISGVVNYVINHKLLGFRAEASEGITQYGDDPKTDASLAWGGKLGERAHLELSYEYRYEGGIDNRSSRPWLNQVGVTGAGTAANPYVLQSNLRQAGFPFGGLTTIGGNKMVFNAAGVPVPFTNGATTGTSAIQVGGDGGYWDSSLISKLRAHQAFGRFDYDVADNVHAYVQASGNFKTNTNYAETAQLTNVNISRTNAFLSPAVQAMFPATSPTFALSELMSDVPRAQATADSQQFIFTGGFSGKVHGITWNIDYTHGLSKLNTNLANDVNRQKLGYALDAVNSNGKIVCNVTVTNPGLADNCVPINVFGPGNVSAAAASYITDTVNYKATTIQDDITGGFSGSPFSTWAGEVNAALSAEWRKVSFHSSSSSTPANLVDCTGIRFNNCTAGGALNDFQFGQSLQPVSQTVWEVAGEFDAPILKDSAIAKSLSINGAARTTSYNTSGHYWTWKIGFDWAVSDKLRFRGTKSRDIRAPTLYDLFAPTSSVPVRPTDLLTNTSPTVPSINPSNPNLKAEIGNSFTAGVVFKPTRRLSFAIDGYDIKISNAITQIDGSTTAFQNACYASGGSSPYCALQVRPNGYTSTATSNAVQAWIVQNVNISQIETWGVDFETNYAATLFSRPASLRALVAWQPHIYYQQPNVATIDQGGAAFGPTGLGASPSVRVSVMARFQPVNHVTVDIMERWRNAMKLSGDPTQVFVNNHVAAFGTTALNVAWDVDASFGRMQYFVNVQNLFNATPPIGAYSGNGTRAGLRDGFALGDDPRGRSFAAGVKMKF